MRVSLVVVFALLWVGRTAFAQELDADPNRIFVTPLKWKSVAGGSRDKSANGTLAILYAEGVYAEVTGAFVKRGGKQQIGLNLKDGFVVRLGTWNRIEDSDLIRVESQETLRSPEEESKLDGPLTVRTCRLELPSPVHIADAIVCKDLMVVRPQSTIDLSGFPSIVRHLVEAKKNGHEPSGSQ